MEQRQALKCRTVSRSWEQGAALATEQLQCEVNSSTKLDSLIKCLKRLLCLRRLDFQSSPDLRAEDLGRLIEAVHHLEEVDVTLARPLEWPSYKELLHKFSSIRFVDVLTQCPHPKLTPWEVIFTQCYGLHAGRIDVCFAYASEKNRQATGPLERFTAFFQEPSSYSIMMHSEWFELGDIVGRESTATCVVEFGKQGHRRLFNWELSCQPDDCWATDSVTEASWHDMMMAELDE